MQVTTCPVEYRQGSNFEEVRVHEAIRAVATTDYHHRETQRRTTASSKRARVLGERRRKEKWSPF